MARRNRQWAGASDVQRRMPFAVGGYLRLRMESAFFGRCRSQIDQRTANLQGVPWII